MNLDTSKHEVTDKHYLAAYDLALPILQSLSQKLTYHNLQHTKGVVEAAAHISNKENLTEDQVTLLKTAALFHDTGFINGYHEHEQNSCEIARELLPQVGYPNNAIDEICKLIMVTRLPQQPGSLSEQILCDADLYYLGAPNFYREAENLYREFLAEGIVADRDEWDKRQLTFLENHKYFTATATIERAKQKAVFLKQVRAQRKTGQRKSYVSEKAFGSFREIILMLIGTLVAGFALKSLLVPNHFFDGGVTGISLLLHEIYNINLALVIILANLPLIAIGYFTVNKTFALKTLLCVALLSVCLLVIPYPPIETSDNILVAVFGGFFLGTGIGLCMRAGCALDGIEVLALKAFKKTSFTVTEMILAINIIIFSVAALQLGIMTALYSILTYFTASKTIDYVVEGIEAYTGVTIISAQSDLLKHRLVNELGRGITVYKGERGFLPGQFETSSECDIIFTVVTRLEMRRLQNLVHQTDPNAFVIANTIREASGGILSRRAKH